MLTQTSRERGRHDVIVVGAGAAGVAAALAAARTGAQVLLLEELPYVGGDLVSGLPAYGCLNARGEWIVGGIPRDIVEGCSRLDGYIGPVFDWRTVWGVCFDPEVIKLTLVDALASAGVDLRIQCTVHAVDRDGTSITGVEAWGKGRKLRFGAPVAVDCTGDGQLSVLAGAEYEAGGERGEFQPVSLVFRVADVCFNAFLDFVRDDPSQFLLAENPIIGRSPSQCAQALHDGGYPYAALSAVGSLMADAQRLGQLFECTALFISPTSMARHEVTINATRIANVDASDAQALSGAYPQLVRQVEIALRFLRARVPGFEKAVLSGVAPRVGVRETRRIRGEMVLSEADVLAAIKRPDGVARGGHHVDIHGGGTYQLRLPVADGGSYDIPYGCLVPRGLGNLLVAGRCLSSTRQANGSARVMGTCMATGQAAGVAAALCATRAIKDVRDLPIGELRNQLVALGAVLAGTH